MTPELESTAPSWHVLPGSQCDLGESPVWCPTDQSLVWIDIARCLVLRQDIATGAIDRWPLPCEPGCIAAAVRGHAQGAPWGWVLALRDGIWHAETFGGPLRLLAEPPYDPAHTRFNDGRADPLGRFWASTLFEPRNAPAAALYCLDLRDPQTPGALERMAGDAVVGNGLAFAPDCRTVYWADTTSHLVRAWDWDAPHNRLNRVHVFHQFQGKPLDWTADFAAFAEAGDAARRQAALRLYGGRPDGATVDASGHYWVAMYEGARVLRLSPQGRVVQELTLPAMCPTMPCLGGPDRRTLYVTTASQGRSAAELLALPHSGCVFATRVEVPGIEPTAVVCH